MSQSEQIGDLAGALALASLEFGKATKNATNPHFGKTYTNLEGAITATRDALANQGLVVLQRFTTNATLVTTLAHKSGQWISGEQPLMSTKQDPQGIGSASTYARRYGLMAILGIAPEDDDGNAGSAPNADQIAGVTVTNCERVGTEAKPVFRVSFSNGGVASTFSATLAKIAKEAFDAQRPVTISVKRNGEFFNLEAIA